MVVMGNADARWEFPIYPIYPIRPIRPIRPICPIFPILPISLYLYQSILNGVDYQVGGVAAPCLFEDVCSVLIYRALRDK